MKNTFGQSVTLTLFGESHGPAVGAVLDGLAPGLTVDEAFISRQLARRRPTTAMDTARREADHYQILSGVFQGRTTGTPLAIVIPNENTRSGDYTYGLARPSHADYAAYCKYHGYEDWRGGGHFFGRVTAALGAGGNYPLAQKKPDQTAGAQPGGFFPSMQTTPYAPGGGFLAPDGARQGPPPAATQAPAQTNGWGGFGNVISGAITPDENEIAQEESAFLFDLESDYACYMTLSQDELANLSLVEGLLFLDASDDEDTILIELGAMQNAGIDWTTGDIVSGFDGTWPMLEDQIVVMYDQIRTQNMRRSLIPVTLNGTSGYLVMVFTTANPDGVIAGFTEGYDANGLPVRGLTPLQKGDELIPIYPMLYDDGSDSDEFAEDTFEGDPIIVGDTLPVFEYVSLEGTDSTFYYCFQLTDIFGETELSDFIEFEM